jgi:hypothetical protein
LPAFKNGGANGGRVIEVLSKKRDIAAMPRARRATST